MPDVSGLPRGAAAGLPVGAPHALVLVLAQVGEHRAGLRAEPGHEKAFTCILICLDYTHSLASRAGDGGRAQFPRLYCRCRPDAHDMSELSDVEERLLLCVECAGGAKIGEPYSG